MSAIINIKTDPKIKTTAQKIAAELGFSLSGIINAYLREFVRTKTVHVTLEPEKPSPALIKAIKEAEEDLEKGRTMSFDNAKDAINYLDKLIKKKK